MVQGYTHYHCIKSVYGSGNPARKPSFSAGSGFDRSLWLIEHHGVGGTRSAYLIEQLKLLIKNPELLGHGESHRSELQRLTRLASVALETKQESMQRIMFTHLLLVTARLSNEFRLLDALAKGNNASPVAPSDLIKASSLAKSLVSATMDYHCYHDRQYA
ncbi:hypothetical protein MGYG_04356 [Nannizzia gypsea CBS 118893]|uniref:Uncharacterized protein n=1 Tax=Arthroderma gypseum (strain ATCC MYA-4604 / CBS 118893) TaxID=535722 RepID=E4USJ8_ARTGP|nr:hypothetical protein MGYG_04356 [Nannizzia gypsea CBS 118893]EFR01349.1 hypothetical protein MGYG_04356 [Nannizzia gypsea CBS 118893]